jgi:exodeoxyribonuclease VII small subunit
MSEQTVFDFEQALKDLEALVARMESGELTLDDSLKAFEEGIRLSRSCQQALASAEQKVQIMLENNGESVAQPFHADGGEP